MTNLERIQKINAEEMGEFMFKFSLSVHYNEIIRDNKQYLRFGNPKVEIEHTKNGFLDWLNKEAAQP